MYTTDRAEQVFDDIRKVLLLYERGIIDDNNVKELINRIVELYVTKTVVPVITGQNCKNCLYYTYGHCMYYGKNGTSIVEDPNSCCDNWDPAIKADITKE